MISLLRKKIVITDITCEMIKLYMGCQTTLPILASLQEARSSPTLLWLNKAALVHDRPARRAAPGQSPARIGIWLGTD